VTAAASEEPMPTANLTAVMDRIAPAIARLKGKATGDRLVNLAIEANAYESAQYLLASSSILREAVATRELMVIKAVYEMGTGKVVRLR
jgi:carbonic anhydrase